jgi:small subunit ribosomal protein S2
VSMPTMRELLEAGVHFGHQTRRWNPRMKKYIFIARNGIHIIDLQKTVECLTAAREAVARRVAGGGSVLFVGTKKQAKDIILEETQRCGQYAVTERWLGGMLTNFKTIKSSIARLRELERMIEDGTMASLTKKEAAHRDKERAKLEKVFSGIKEIDRLPSVVFVVDTTKERIAVAEANRLRIPVVGIVDTNSDPSLIDYPIPGNDDALRSIKLITHVIADAVLESQRSAEAAVDYSQGYSAGGDADEDLTPVPSRSGL